MSSLAFVFPGQGSQAVGMLAALADAYPLIRQTFAEASEVLGRDLWQLVQKGPEEALNRTSNTQPAMLAAGVAVWRVWGQQRGPLPALMAGHSLGEYSALVCAGALGFTEAVRLVAERARLMQEAVAEGNGAMAAILGLDDVRVRDLCAQAAAGEVVEAVNLNAPGQVVIAGDRSAVERAIALAKASGARRALTLAVSVPAHCALMRPAAEGLAEALALARIDPPQIPVLHNASVETTTDPGQIRALLALQLYRPVRWVETVQTLEAEGIITLVEAGPGKVLVGLNKRISRHMQALPVLNPQTLDQALEEASHAN
jgi:[acyl-carrier-protein] S-malonyltransferase